MRAAVRFGAAMTLIIAGTLVTRAQPPVPQPFPRPDTPSGQPSGPPAARPPAGAPPAPAAPTEARLGLPIYPRAEFLASYDAGRGQRYYLFGTTSGFAELVAYYRTALKEKGELVFETPPTHMFEVGKFKEEAVAFPPGVTIKDYTSGGFGGYLNPKSGGQPARFPTIIQIVPLPEAAGVPPR